MGAPWAYSAFNFEDAGGGLVKLFHGSNKIHKQIFDKFLARKKLINLASRVIPHTDNFQLLELYERFDGPFFFSAQWAIA